MLYPLVWFGLSAAQGWDKVDLARCSQALAQPAIADFAIDGHGNAGPQFALFGQARLETRVGRIQGGEDGGDAFTRYRHHLLTARQLPMERRDPNLVLHGLGDAL